MLARQLENVGDGMAPFAGSWRAWGASLELSAKGPCERARRRMRPRQGPLELVQVRLEMRVSARCARAAAEQTLVLREDNCTQHGVSRAWSR
jgi:hypothetical protein